MRVIHFLVIGVLVFAAAYVYRIKMESTSRVERVLRLNAEIREQRDAIAALCAEWAKLDAPLRLQGLAERHLGLKPLNALSGGLLHRRAIPHRPTSRRGHCPSRGLRRRPRRDMDAFGARYRTSCEG